MSTKVMDMSVDCSIVTQAGSIEIPETKPITVNEFFALKRSEGLVIEPGPGFSAKFCNVPIDGGPPESVDVFQINKTLSWTEVIAALGGRWKPVSLRVVLLSVNHPIVQLAPDTFFLCGSDVVFFTGSQGDWFVDIGGNAYQQPGAQFGVPANS